MLLSNQASAEQILLAQQEIHWPRTSVNFDPWVTYSKGH